ncbi:MAG: prolyl oligopeptidase family serine peptidase [Patescibacteria group bacterium]|nr:prolyl oligopeptidase family serine peptidase [Patescibacteria group bacterium]
MLNVPDPFVVLEPIDPEEQNLPEEQPLAPLADMLTEDALSAGPTLWSEPRPTRPSSTPPTSTSGFPKPKIRRPSWVGRCLKASLAAGVCLFLAVGVIAIALGGLKALLKSTSVVVTEPPPPADPASFPARGPMRSLLPGVLFSELRLGIPSGTAGERDRLSVYFPPGDHAPRSLPCVLIAPAGSNMLSGMALSEGDQAEHTPYVSAGFAVVAYELDAPIDLENCTVPEARQAMRRFGAAQAGLVNARNALDYIAHRLPEVDSNRIYAAGHSSAGTVALMLAEHEPRIKGCAAYAPCSDPEERYRSDGIQLRMALPGAFELLAHWSPRNNEEKLHCPLFLFHARNDSNVPYQETADFAQRLQQLGKQVTFESISSGDHYDSMIQHGIPRGTAWLCTLAGLPQPAPKAVPLAETPPASDRVRAALAHDRPMGSSSTGEDGDIEAEFERHRAESDRRLEESQRDWERERREAREAFERRAEESRRAMDQRMEESRRQMEEDRREMEERSRRMRER